MIDMVLEIYYKDIFIQHYLKHGINNVAENVPILSKLTNESEDVLIKISYQNSNVFLIETDKLKLVKEQNKCLEIDSVYMLTNVTNGEVVKIICKEKETSIFNFKKYHCDSMKEITIGRDNANIISINNNSVSSFHCNIKFTDGKVFLVDNGSKNGVYINNKKVEKSRIRFGDAIYICGIKIIYLGNLFAISNYKNTVKVRLYEFDKKACEKKFIDDIEDNSENNYFTRSPRLSKKIQIQKEEIEAIPMVGDTSQQPLILMMGPSLTMGLAMLGSLFFTMKMSQSNKYAMIPGLITTFAMLAGAIVWPIALRNYQMGQSKKSRSILSDKYKKYIESIKNQLIDKQKQNIAIYNEIYPTLKQCFQISTGRERRLWERNPSDNDFLDIRIGVGVRKSTVDIIMPKDKFSQKDDPFKNEIIKISNQFKYITDVPVSVNLKKYMTGVIGEKNLVNNTLSAMIVQLSVLHSYTEVKICLVANESSKESWNWVKFLPHTWNNNKDIRFISNNVDELRPLFAYLSEVSRERKAEASSYNKTILKEYYIIIITDKDMENEFIVRNFLNDSENTGFSLVFAYDNLSMLPKECENIIQCTESESSIYDKKSDEDKMFSYLPDVTADFDFSKFSKAMTRINLKQVSGEYDIPQMITFMDLFKVSSVEELDVLQRWTVNQTSKTMEAPIGYMSGNKIFSLNIHEKFHGPHGLIAGMTGSGKSEFIQTYILSLAVNYSPHEISFLLIDYKGGGMANCFKNLPHLVGTITNLGGSQIHRSLVSLKSELKRRQLLFSYLNVNHIDKYQEEYNKRIEKGETLEPLPKLIIIADEFAELKKDQPDFMHELVSAARIGRSLGVFLILATQRPSGVVDEQIWSNTRFRVCLKVLDKSDSNEMLKQPDASLITQPGRCYVQVGNNEIFELVQSGWSDAPYIEGEKFEATDKFSVSLIGIDGDKIETAKIKKKTKKTNLKQLNVIVENLVNMAKEQKITLKKLWKDPIGSELYLDELINIKEFDNKLWNNSDKKICPIVGLYDDPSTQTQKPLKVDIGESGNLAIFGSPSTGKTTFLETLIYSIGINNSPENINFYILDFGGRTLTNFSEMPHVGEIIFSDDEEKIEKFFNMIKLEIDIRKKIFVNSSVGNISAYLDDEENKMPYWQIIIDNFSAFSELYPDYVQELVTLVRDGGNYGVLFILTGNSPTSINYKILQSIKLIYALNLNDKYDYTSLVGNMNGLEIENYKGRGVAKLDYPVEFQTALAVRGETEGKRAKTLQENCKKMNTNYKGTMPKKIVVVPSVLSYSEFENIIAEHKVELNLPIGILADTGEVIGIDYKNNSLFPIVGSDRKGKTSFLKSICRTIRNMTLGCIYLIENNKNELETFSKEIKSTGYAYNGESTDLLIDTIYNELLSRYKKIKEADGEKSKEKILNESEYIFVLIDNFKEFFDSISNESMSKMVDITKNSKGLKIVLFFTGTPSKFNEFRSQALYEVIFEENTGMLLGGAIAYQSAFVVDIDQKNKNIELEAGTGYLISDGKNELVKTPY